MWSSERVHKVCGVPSDGGAWLPFPGLADSLLTERKRVEEMARETRS